MRTIRKRCFETNSSSMHSLCVCSESEYQQWIDGKLIYDVFTEELIQKEDMKDGYEFLERYLTYQDYSIVFSIGFETYKHDSFGDDGRKYIAFGYHECN